MLPSRHLILGAFFSLALLALFPKIGVISFFIILFSSVLIDVDHYIYYVYSKRDISLIRAYTWFAENENKFISLPRKKRNLFYGGFFFLHGFEILLIFFFLGIFISKYLFFIFVGFALHLIIDIIYQTIYMDRIDKFSIINDFIKFRKLKIIDEYEK